MIFGWPGTFLMRYHFGLLGIAMIGVPSLVELGANPGTSVAMARDQRLLLRHGLG